MCRLAWKGDFTLRELSSNACLFLKPLNTVSYIQKKHWISRELSFHDMRNLYVTKIVDGSKVYA